MKKCISNKCWKECYRMVPGINSKSIKYSHRLEIRLLLSRWRKILWNFHFSDEISKLLKFMNLHWILSLMWLSTTNRKIDTFFSYKVIHSESLVDWHALESWLHWSQFTETDLSEVWLLFSDSQSTHWITCVALSERNSFSTRENFYDFWEKKTMFCHLMHYHALIPSGSSSLFLII